MLYQYDHSKQQRTEDFTEKILFCYVSLDVVSDEEAGVGGNVRPDELSVSSCLDSSLQLKHINHIFKEQTLNKSS